MFSSIESRFWIEGKARWPHSSRSQSRHVTPIGTEASGLLEIDAVRVDEPPRVRDLAAELDARAACGASRSRPALLRIVRATEKYVVPSGICETCVRTVCGVMKALCTFQRGHAPEKRANRMPEAENRLEMLPAMSTRIRWNGTPSRPGRCSVVSRWQTCSKLDRKRWPSSSTSYRTASADSRNRS